MNLGELTSELMDHFKFWAKVADYYEKQCTKVALTMYAQHSSEFSVDDLVSAFKKYIADPKHVYMPRPAQLIEYLRPHLNPDAEAKQIAGRVVKAVSDHGWPNSSKARADIGEAGWNAVQAYGGWTYICENLGTSISMGQFQAQIRDHAKAYIECGGRSYNENQIEGQGSAKLDGIVRKLASVKGMP
jgi:hypothetical protein